MQTGIEMNLEISTWRWNSASGGHPRLNLTRLLRTGRVYHRPPPEWRLEGEDGPGCTALLTWQPFNACCPRRADLWQIQVVEFIQKFESFLKTKVSDATVLWLLALCSAPQWHQLIFPHNLVCLKLFLTGTKKCVIWEMTILELTMLWSSNVYFCLFSQSTLQSRWGQYKNVVPQ